MNTRAAAFALHGCPNSNEEDGGERMAAGGGYYLVSHLWPGAAGRGPARPCTGQRRLFLRTTETDMPLNYLCSFAIYKIDDQTGLLEALFIIPRQSIGENVAKK